MATSAITPAQLAALDPDADLQLYTAGEAARFLRTTTGSLAQMRFKKTGPRFVLLGVSVRYRRRDLLEYIQHHNFDANAVPPGTPRRKGGLGRPKHRRTRRSA